MSWAKGETVLINNSYIVSIETKEFDKFDEELFIRYGEPTINVGGLFEEGDLSFTVDESNKKIKSNSPFTKSFDTTNDEDAGDKAILYMNTILGRIQTRLTTFRSNDSTSYKGITKIVSI